MRVGVLALQGDHAAHVAALERAAAARAGVATGEALEILEVRRPEQLVGLCGIVLPGGESTTLLKLLALDRLDDALSEHAASGGAVLGTCAGAILLAREVVNPAQPSLGLLDLVVERNSYGRQVDSFVAELSLAPGGAPEGKSERPQGPDAPLPGVFIRAPRILEAGPAVEVLARHAGDPVLVRQGRVLATTFHPELTGDLRVHELFLRQAMRTRDEAARAREAPGPRGQARRSAEAVESP